MESPCKPHILYKCVCGCVCVVLSTMQFLSGATFIPENMVASRGKEQILNLRSRYLITSPHPCIECLRLHKYSNFYVIKCFELYSLYKYPCLFNIILIMPVPGLKITFVFPHMYWFSKTVGDLDTKCQLIR